MCEYCTEYKDLPEHIIDGKPVGRVFDTCLNWDENGWHIELPSGCDIGIKFCPYCGRNLPHVNCNSFQYDASQECNDCGCLSCKWLGDCNVCENRSFCTEREVNYERYE